jgi:hypothetical protein
MTTKRNIFHHPLFGAASGFLIVILGFMFEFYFQKGQTREETQTNDNISMKQQLKTFRIIDSMDYNELDKRLVKLESKNP